MHRRNNLDALRLAGAVLVVVGHAFVLTGVGHVPRLGGIPLHSLGLYLFFTLSGYLISASWSRNAHLAPFLRNRVLRIFPALIVVVIFTVAVIGPAVTSVSLPLYAGDGQTWTYLLNLILVPQYELPGVFTDNPHSSAVNGVLWTLGIEFCCYLFTAAAGIVLRSRAWVALAVLAVAAAACATVPFTAPLRSIGEVTVFFALGALAYHAGISQQRLLPLWPLAIAIPAALIVGALAPEASPVIAWLVVPYLVLALGLRCWPVARRASRFGDLSYGVYLWGFLVQQLVLQVAPRLPFAVSLATTLVVTAGIAVLSWHVVEKRALSHAVHD
jgi:peptidoglycan/LPS O-acetylase OafA/YrhL